MIPIDVPRAHGSSFSAAISAATNAIHGMLITPSANSAAMRAQQQPTHQAPCSTPRRKAPSDPSRQPPNRNDIGDRHFFRQARFIGVSS